LSVIELVLILAVLYRLSVRSRALASSESLVV
jgi:hypothetical protein